jgi:exopolysaccharide biosynthesis protein
VITKNKLAVVGDAAAYDTLKTNIQEGLGGGVLLVKNNVIVSQTDASINPRTCLGVSSDYKRVFMLVVDGRNYHYSNGMTYEESGKCMIALGAKDAINLDGGGSSTFFIRNSSDFSSGRFVL